MVTLPSISALRKRCQALAALDLILSPEWEYRSFSFNAAWAPGQQMASMRNGSGDEWFCHFHPSGWAALKGFDHESRAWSKGGGALSAALRDGIPPALAEFSAEPAFCWDSTSFAFYRVGDDHPWVRVIQQTIFSDLATGEDEQLALLVGPPADYVRYAADYFEREIAEDDVAAVFSHHPMTPEIVQALNPDAVWSEIAGAMGSEIGFPSSQ